MSTHPPDRHRWSAFWTERGNGWHLSVFRLIWTAMHLEFAIAIIFVLLRDWHAPALHYPGFSAAAGLFPIGTAIILATFLAAVCAAALGWRTRMAQCAVAVCALLLFVSTAALYHNHTAFYLLVTIYITLAPTERWYSLDARRMRKKLGGSFVAWQNEPVSFFAQKLILVQLSFLYLFSGLNKLDPEWILRWSSTAEFATLSDSAFATILWESVQVSGLAVSALIGMAFLEMSLAAAVFAARRFPLLVLLPITLHALFEFALPIIQFTELCLAIWFLALVPTGNTRLNNLWNKQGTSDRSA